MEPEPLQPTPDGQPPVRLPGLGQRGLEKLKTKEAMVLCLIRSQFGWEGISLDEILDVEAVI